MKYRIEDSDCIVFIERKNNKNTYIRLKDDLNIYVTTSYFTTNKTIKKILDDNYDYLVKSMERQKVKKEKKALFYYLGDVYDIITISDKKIEIIGNRIYVKDREYLEKWYKKQMKKIFSERLNYWYNEFEENIPYPNLKIRKMTTRWGVCNKKTNTVTLNSELMKYSLDKLDYVIIHELSHFIHFNHSTNFWLLVSKYCKDYKKVRKELRD